jgi:hypothetical protein
MTERRSDDDRTGRSCRHGTCVLTILARLDTHQFPELVFDKVNGVVSLSEIWFAGTDGYLVLATKGEHEHQLLQSK